MKKGSQEQQQQKTTNEQTTRAKKPNQNYTNQLVFNPEKTKLKVNKNKIEKPSKKITSFTGMVVFVI